MTKAELLELERLFQQRGAFRLETRAVTGTTLDDLDRRRQPQQAHSRHLEGSLSESTNGVTTFEVDMN